jgi:hypothetical protein
MGSVSRYIEIWKYLNDGMTNLSQSDSLTKVNEKLGFNPKGKGD